ncbi:MAG TPA: hypothetical protein VF135_11710 [Terriglobales bacterium]
MRSSTGLAVAALVICLGSSSLAMPYGRSHDRNGSYNNAYDNDHGKKKGWNDGSLPRGKAKKESRMWQKEHRHEAEAHRKEMRERQREARAYRHKSHVAVVHRQPKPNTEARSNPLKAYHNQVEANKRIKAEQKREAQQNRP